MPFPLTPQEDPDAQPEPLIMCKLLGHHWEATYLDDVVVKVCACGNMIVLDN